MTKRFNKELALFTAGDNIKFTFGVLICTILAAFSLVVAAFTAVNISHYYIPVDAILHPIIFSNTQHTTADFIISFSYVPQIPAIAFMTVILGKKYSSIAILLYLITGLFILPVFSLGGGIKYVGQYSFGYVLGFIPMVIVLANQLKNNFKPMNVIKASLFSVLILHLVGMIYLILVCAIRHDQFGYFQDLLNMLTFSKILYDWFFIAVCTYLANIVRKILWLVMD